MEARWKTQKEVEEIKQKYPAGTKICLIKMQDPYPVPPGTLGTVDFVDDQGQIHTKWKSGSSLALEIDVDEFEIVHPQRVTLSWDHGPKLVRTFLRKSEAIAFVAEAKITCKEKKWFPPKVTYEDIDIADVEEIDQGGAGCI